MIDSYDPISSNLLSSNFHSIILSLLVLKPNDGQEDAWTSQIITVSSKRSHYVMLEQLSCCWGIGLDLAARTLKETIPINLFGQHGPSKNASKLIKHTASLQAVDEALQDFY